jgi:hypothetical protein
MMTKNKGKKKGETQVPSTFHVQQSHYLGIGARELSRRERERERDHKTDRERQQHLKSL